MLSWTVQVSLSDTSCFGKEVIEDEERVGQPLTNKQLLDSDRHLSIHLISEELSLSYDTVQTIIAKNLATKEMYAKFTPRILSDEQNSNGL